MCFRTLGRIPVIASLLKNFFTKFVHNPNIPLLKGSAVDDDKYSGAVHGATERAVVGPGTATDEAEGGVGPTERGRRQRVPPQARRAGAPLRPLTDHRLHAYVRGVRAL